MVVTAVQKNTKLGKIDLLLYFLYQGIMNMQELSLNYLD